MERMLAGQSDNDKFIWILCVEFELVLADSTVKLKGSGWFQNQLTEI